MHICHPLLLALGGGGNRGIPAPPELEGRSSLPNNVPEALGLLRPGIAIEKVCPSLSE
jgi:hypothetical protein